MTKTSGWIGPALALRDAFSAAFDNTTLSENVEIEFAAMGPDQVHIENLVALTRGCGYGRKVMTLLTQTADTCSVTLTLDPVPDDDETPPLREYYGRYNFEDSDSSDYVLIRHPQ